MADKPIEVLLDERRNFPPPKEFKKSANMKNAGTFSSARKNPQAFWAKAAKELHWFKLPGPSGLWGESTPLITIWTGMSKR